MEMSASEQLGQVVRESGLIEPGSRGVALLSGGPDSACLAAGLVAMLGPDAVAGLHVNYGLRTDSDQDQERALALAAELGIECGLERITSFQIPPDSPHQGNLQAEAREHRYEAAEKLRAKTGGTWVATGHTRTDLAETVIYRLASSPGRRAMLGMAPRHGLVVRPLLEIGRDDTRRLALEAELPFYEDPSNADPRFKRVRIRNEILPVLREVNAAAEANISATWAELEEEADALEALAAEVLAEAVAGPSTPALRAEDLAELHPAVRRLALRSLAGKVAARDVALGRQRAAEIWRLANQPEGGEVELGGGLSALCEAGTIRFAVDPDVAPDPADLSVPGQCYFGRWDVRAKLEPAEGPRGPDVATLDAAALGSSLEVRAWRDGDRMRPLGLEGSKSLQDLFTDSHVPRSLRHSLPVVVAGGERIAWVAGVAVSEEFKLTAESTEAAVISAALTNVGFE